MLSMDMSFERGFALSFVLRIVRSILLACGRGWFELWRDAFLAFCL